MKTSQQNKDMKRLVSLLLRQWRAEAEADAWKKRADNYAWAPFGKDYFQEYRLREYNAICLQIAVREVVDAVVTYEQNAGLVLMINDKLANRFLKGRDNIHAKADMYVLLTNILYKETEQ